MKLLLIGDPHLKISKFQLSCEFLAWVKVIAAEIKPDMVVNLGDTFDTHAVVRSEILSEFRKHVLDITELGIHYRYVLGNHDQYKPNDSKYHALESFKGIENFIVVDKPWNSTVENITWVPYIADYKQFPLDTLPIVIAHQTFVGADYGYYRPDVGVDADKVKADMIISGHIHKRQMFGKVVYPGTPFAQGADDVNQQKGLMLFDTETYEYSFIKSPFPSYTGLTYELTQDQNVDTMHASIASQLNGKDMYILDIIGPKAEIIAYMDSKRFKDLKAKNSIRVKPEYIDRQKTLGKQIKVNSISDIVNEYIDQVYDGTLDKGIIKSKAIEILEKQL